MAYLSDEMQDWYDDCREKKHTARSAKNRRGQGRRGPAKLPSDYLTQKQLRAMNGEVATYRLGAPMNWYEFNNMPDDLKVIYVKKLRKLYNVPDEELAMAMGVDILEFQTCLHKLKLNPRHAIEGDYNWYDTDDNGRFHTWWIVSEEEK